MDKQQMIDKLNKEVAELEQSRDQLVQQANQQIAHINGRVEAKREMVVMLQVEDMPSPAVAVEEQPEAVEE